MYERLPNRADETWMKTFHATRWDSRAEIAETMEATDIENWRGASCFTSNRTRGSPSVDISLRFGYRTACKGAMGSMRGEPSAM